MGNALRFGDQNVYLVSKDVFVVVESLTKNHCKDKSLELFH
jgi:hypothetical protein